MGDADEADVPAGSGGTDGLLQRLLSSDRFDDAVRTEASGELFDPRRRRRARPRLAGLMDRRPGDRNEEPDTLTETQCVLGPRPELAVLRLAGAGSNICV
jgi:hypothetical protein